MSRLINGRSIFGAISASPLLMTHPHKVASAGTECHHIVVEDWSEMEKPGGTIFVSMPSLLDPSVSPAGTHLVHIFTPDWIDNWRVKDQALMASVTSHTIEKAAMRQLMLLLRICSVKALTLGSRCEQLDSLDIAFASRTTGT